MVMTSSRRDPAARDLQQLDLIFSMTIIYVCRGVSLSSDRSFRSLWATARSPKSKELSSAYYPSEKVSLMLATRLTMAMFAKAVAS